MKLVPKKRVVVRLCDQSPEAQKCLRRSVSPAFISNLSEHALMGQCVPVSNEWVDRMTYYMLGVLSASYAPGTFAKFSESAGFSVLKRIEGLVPDVRVTHISTCMVYDMPCIVYVLKGKDIVDPFTEDYGSGYPCATCYVFNPTADDQCSEMGDCFFEKHADGMYHRVS